MENYKYTNPFDWLAMYSQDRDGGWLRAALMAVALKCDPDDIQEIFQQEMDESGYFETTES